MSIPFDTLCQNAFVVEDIEAAIAYWTDVMGVGPFFLFPPLRFEQGELHGAPATLEYRAAIAYAGDLMIELIEPNGPSIFQEFLDAGRSGVQHNSMFTHDLDAAEARLAARGGMRVQALVAPNGSRICFYEMPGDAPYVIEVSQVAPALVARLEAVRAAARTWDGSTRLMDA
ncbi:VOC family protein [Sphingomonas mali]|uniref:VOC family protein n=1 Tax=Sphingomonas mali TaxID=40682 RepID=UPI0008336BA8|nr:VOC family protein [Sphingomonas mali]